MEAGPLRAAASPSPASEGEPAAGAQKHRGRQIVPRGGKEIAIQLAAISPLRCRGVLCVSFRCG